MFIPSNLISCKGIVRNVDVGFSHEELTEYSKVLYAGHNIRIISIKRLNRRTNNVDKDGSPIYQPTPTVLFTFSGKILPREVNICMLPMQVVPYVLPVIQCRRCFLFGHTQKNCNGKEKCTTCGGPVVGHDKDACKMSCIHCKSESHSSCDRQCPEYERQKLIREYMSLDNLSFFDANLRVPKGKPGPIRYITKEAEFPSLPADKTDSGNVIPVQQRRNFSNMATQYSHISKKRKSVPVSPGYDVNSHNNCLHNPNGRGAISVTHPGSASPHNPPQWPTVPEGTQVVASDSVATLIYIFDHLTEPQRETFLNHLNNFNMQTSLDNNSNGPSSPDEY